LIQSAHGTADAIIMNPAAYSFTSIALIDALKIFEGPKIEVHISNIHARDELHTAFDYVERFHRCDLRSWSLRIYRGHPGGRANGWGSCRIRFRHRCTAFGQAAKPERISKRRSGCAAQVFLAIWSDISPNNLTDYRHWLTREHTHRTRDDEGIPGVARVPRCASRHPSFLYSLRAGSAPGCSTGLPTLRASMHQRRGRNVSCRSSVTSFAAAAS